MSACVLFITLCCPIPPLKTKEICHSLTGDSTPKVPLKQCKNDNCLKFCLRPEWNFKFHTNPNFVQISQCVVEIVISRFFKTDYNWPFGLQNYGQHYTRRRYVHFACVNCYIFANCSQTPALTLNLSTSSESQWYADSNNILSVRKYYQFFTHESNTLLCKNTSFCQFKPMGAQMLKNPQNSPFLLGHMDPI